MRIVLGLWCLSTLLLACSEKRGDRSATVPSSILPDTPKIETPKVRVEPGPFPNYESVVAMLEADSITREGLTIISESPLHIQVLRESYVLSGGKFNRIEWNKRYKEYEERYRKDIIGIAFDAFAQTKANDFTITRLESNFNSDSASREKEASVYRKNALHILKAFNIASFESLYSPGDDGRYYHNDTFQLLVNEPVIKDVFETLTRQ